LTELGIKLHEVFDAAQNITLITRNAEASERWRIVYGPLSEGSAGLLGAVSARAEAQVMRLASIYAVLDCSNKIRAPHLKAAIALWEYVESSACCLFGDALGDPVADAIQALRQSGELTRTDIRDLFGRNLSAIRIDKALALLLTNGKARREKRQSSDHGSRPSEVWQPC
jgi:hypothetical protein